jgi:hypothetical protein
LLGDKSQIIGRECCGPTATNLFRNQRCERWKVRISGVDQRRTAVLRCVVLDHSRAGRGEIIRTCSEGGAVGRIDNGSTPRLNVMKRRKGSGLTQGLVREVAVGRHIHAENDAREVHMHPRIKAPDEAATTLTEVSSETVERHTEGGDVKDIPDEKALTVQ